MGNGSSSSRSPNTVVVRPVENNQTSFFPERNNNTVASSTTTNSPLSNRLLPTCPQQHELDESIEMAAAPKGMTRQPFEGNGSHSRPVSGVDIGQQPGREPADKIEFEVYHSFQDGRDYTVLNNEGTRFYLDSWETGNVAAVLMIKIIHHHSMSFCLFFSHNPFSFDLSFILIMSFFLPSICSLHL